MTFVVVTVLTIVVEVQPFSVNLHQHHPNKQDMIII
jgi:hypothetical protein